MGIGNRIKELRKHLNLSQRAFGEKIGVSRDVIKNMELELVETKEHFIKLISKEFNINEDWLKTGDGNMSLATPSDDELMFLFAEAAKAENEVLKNSILSLKKLTNDELLFLIEMIKKIKG